MKVAMLGTRGVPAHYGGFETAVEEIGARMAAMGDEVVVYSRNPGQAMSTYRGMTVRNIPALRRKNLETLSHTLLSILHLGVRERRVDVALVFNAGNAPLLPLLRARRVPFAVNVDGLEWKRAKWQGFAARYYRWAEKFSLRAADRAIADAQAIQDYLLEAHGRDSEFIPYGTRAVERRPEALAELGLQENGYHLVVARFEPENHVLELVRGYVSSGAKLPLVVVGSAPYASDYCAEVGALADRDPRVRLLGGVWDQDLLDQLYACAASYLHGHSVGGTNPSLLRALGAAAPVTAVDVSFNREVTGGHAVFVDAVDAAIAEAIEEDEKTLVEVDRLPRGAAGQGHALATYDWDVVARAYRDLCLRLAGRSRTRAEP